MAIQPDGDRVLFTNIDADPAKRAEFWTQVEEHERSAGSDQMSCRFADQPDFWAAATRRNDCPPALRDQHALADHNEIVRFDIDSGKAMRTFLKQLDGWVAKNGDEQAFARFHDGRAGRTQYRIVGELPDELPMAGKVQLLRDFTEEFRRRRIPFVAVMHAPDHNNNEKNWHFHLVYYDRPCARITAAQIAELEQNGHDTGRLAPGMWDFAAATVKKDRVNRELWPLRQKKVAQVGNDRWIKNLRHSFANMTNVQLEQAGVARRVDPRRHADMGIVADPQEHLGTRQAAAETRGTVTAAGTRNEERQSQAIVTQIDQAHAQALADATKRVADLKRRIAAGPAHNADAMTEVERNLIAAADLDRLAAGLRHADDRAVSRATNLKRMNGQLVQAIDADASAGSRRERQSRAGIVAGADQYLHILDVALRDDRRLIADCTDEAARRREAARLAEVRLEELAATPAVAPKLVTEPMASPPQPIVDPVEQWLRQIEQRRPLIVADGQRFALAGIKSPIGIDTAPAQARLGKLYRRQQDDIADIVRWLPAHRLSLGIRAVNGRTRRYLDGVEPALARAFFRYQDSPEIQTAVDAIIHPEVAARSAQVFAPPVRRTPVTAAKTVADPVPLQQGVAEREMRQVAAAPAIAAAVASPPSDPSPAEPIAPILPVAKMPDRAPAPPTPAQEPPSPDPAIVARDLVARNVPLTFDEDDRIDQAALLAAKVDAGIVAAMQNNAYLAGRVGMQVEQALARVQKHARSKPLNLIRRGEQISLGGDAPAELIELSRFHARAPRMQDQLRQLHDELNASVGTQAAPTVAPIKAPLSKGEQASSEVPKSPSSADILHGEAARQAALRAAWHRNR